jgi:MFS family permease
MRMLRQPGPIRTFAVVTLVNTVGNGLLATAVVLYFTRVVHLSGAQVGVGLTVAGGLGLLVGVPLGHVADRVGPREVLLVLMIGEGISTASYVLVGSYPAFLVAAAFVVVTHQGSSAVRQGLIAQVVNPAARVQGRALLRAVTNVGFAIGSAIAALAIVVDTRGAYDALILGDAATFACAAALLLRLPHVPPEPPRAAGDTGPRLIVLRDKPYLLVTLLVAIMTMHFSLLDVGIPLWVSGHTDAPNAIVGVIFVINCILVALLSVRLARGSDTVEGAARSGLRASFLLAASCLVFALASGTTATVASIILIAAAVIEVFGEMTQAASGWGLAFGLAPDHAQGQYQGLSSTGFAFAQMLGPATMAAVTSAGTAGWIAFGAVFLVAGAITVPVARWAEDQRAAAPAAAR